VKRECTNTRAVADRQTRVAFISSGREQISAVAARLDECEKYANPCVCMRARDKTRELCVRRMAEEQSSLPPSAVYTHTHLYGNITRSDWRWRRVTYGAQK
jgi:hypothetical protein